MHAVYIHIDETLGEAGMRRLQGKLQDIDHITDVEINARTPHDLLVEFEEQHISPVAILRELSRNGVHADIMSG